MFNFPSSHYEILADVISHKYRSAIIPKCSRKRFESRLFVCNKNISLEKFHFTIVHLTVTYHRMVNVLPFFHVEKPFLRAALSRGCIQIRGCFSVETKDVLYLLLIALLSNVIILYS